MSAPIYERLKQYTAASRVSFAMPGHKRRTDFSGLARMDVTELEATADLHAESDAVREANALLAGLYGAGCSFILTSGSTTALHAMIMSCVKPGETLLVTPDCHMSAVGICAAAGVNIRAASADYDAELGVCRGIKSVNKYLNEYPDIRAVLVTSPNYYGFCSDIAGIAEECRAHGKPLLVDEAHGAHFAASERLPETSVKYADMVCHSAHKTLNALTGAAYLHVSGDLINPQRVRRFINIFETSSPSYVIAASADIARDELENGGWETIIDRCEEFKRRVNMLGILPFDNSDPTRIALSLRNLGITGFDAARALAEKYEIDVEMADAYNIVLIASPNNTKRDFERLYAALEKITSVARGKRIISGGLLPLPHTGLINPSEALFSDGAEVPIEDAAGMVSRVCVTAYPPGTPIIFAGEAITERHINAIAALRSAGAKITGMNNDMIDTVKV